MIGDGDTAGGFDNNFYKSINHIPLTNRMLYGRVFIPASSTTKTPNLCLSIGISKVIKAIGFSCNNNYRGSIWKVSRSNVVYNAFVLYNPLIRMCLAYNFQSSSINLVSCITNSDLLVRGLLWAKRSSANHAEEHFHIYPLFRYHGCLSLKQNAPAYLGDCDKYQSKLSWS